MKEQFHQMGLAKLCGWLGITLLTYYQESWKEIEVSQGNGSFTQRSDQHP